MVLEHLRITDIAAHGLDRAVSGNVQDLEQAGLGFGSRGDVAGALRMAAELIGIEADTPGVLLDVSAIDRVLSASGKVLPF